MRRAIAEDALEGTFEEIRDVAMAIRHKKTSMDL